MDFENFLAIPGVYTKEKISFDKFIKIETKKQLDYVISRKKDSLVFKKSFLIKEEDWGYTILLSPAPNQEIFLLRTKENQENEFLRPRFLKGTSDSTKIKNDYVNFLLDKIHPGVEFFQCELIIDNVWKIIEATEEISANKENMIPDLEKSKSFTITSLSQLETI